MKKKTKQVAEFLNALHEHIVTDHQLRKDTSGKSEVAIQTEIRPIIVNFLRKYFKRMGYKDAEKKANVSFYWEGQEGIYGKERQLTFGSRTYPDFIITQPYLLAIEYKQSNNGGVVKQGIGQSIMHTLSGDFDYVYYLFFDQNKDKKISKSIENENEAEIIRLI
jgi:hypothetical protein